jgi:hypothetical protein
MDFELVGQIVKIETIAVGHGIRELQNLKRLFGAGRWRKLKGEAKVKLPSGRVRLAEIHWYEAHGTGRRKWKIKRFLD